MRILGDLPQPSAWTSPQPPWCRESPKISEMLLDPHDLASGNFVPARE
ncbi:hypothetical protein ABZX85_36335 [Streptomyces sp. NPDC004539]